MLESLEDRLRIGGFTVENRTKQRCNSSFYWAIGLRMGPAGPARSLVGRSQEKERCGTIFGTFLVPHFWHFFHYLERYGQRWH
jgi:hypothetical protein